MITFNRSFIENAHFYTANFAFQSNFDLFLVIIKINKNAATERISTVNKL